MCIRWLNSFESFLADVGPKPTPQHTLERKNNDGNYEPGNVMWATRRVQARNRSTSRTIEYKGVRKTLAEWAEQTGLTRHTISQRLDRCGYTVEQALETPPIRYRRGGAKRGA